MPSVTLNQKVVEKLLGKKLSLEELKDRISMMGTDLDSIADGQIKVEIFPNRPDLLCEHGFARALSSFIGVKKGLRSYDVKASGHKVIVDSSVTMRPFTVCAIVRGLNITEEQLAELIQLQEKLATTHGRNRAKSAYGIYPFANISFPLKYVALDPAAVSFQPLGFGHPMKASEVVELHPKGRAYAHLTKGWTKYPFFVDAKENVLCMLPFTNSEDTGKVIVGEKELFLESSGTDLRNCQVALNIMVTALADMGGKVESLEIVYPAKSAKVKSGNNVGTIVSPDLSAWTMKFDSAEVEKVLGLKLKNAEIVDLFARMGFSYSKGVVSIPCYRADILHPVDFVEDIAIAYGYENFKPVIPKIATIGEQDSLEKFISKLRVLCVGLGITEVVNYHLASKDDLSLFLASESEKIVALKNAISEHNHLRQSLLPGLLKTLSTNQHNEYPQEIFEVGRIFAFDSSFDCGVREDTALGIALCHEKADFTEIQQKVDAFCVALGLQIRVKEMTHPSFITGRVGALVAEKKMIGFIGEVHPRVLTSAGVMMPVVVGQIDLRALYTEIPK